MKKNKASGVLGIHPVLFGKFKKIKKFWRGKNDCLAKARQSEIFRNRRRKLALFYQKSVRIGRYWL